MLFFPINGNEFLVMIYCILLFTCLVGDVALLMWFLEHKARV